MNVWIIMSGEPLEMFGERPHRKGLLSKMLAEKGHNVTWWTTDFDHQHKKYFYNEDKEIKNEFGVNMIFLHPTTPYKRNISYARIKNHKEVGLKFREISSKKDKPDIILCDFPTIDLAYEAVLYGKKYNIPVVIDIRDMWPEIFLDILPNFLKPLGKLVLNDYFLKTKYIFKNAYALTSMTDEFLTYGLKYGNRVKTLKDKSFPFAYPEINLKEDSEKKALDKFRDLRIKFNKFTICYFGTIGKQFDFEPLIKVARNIDDIQFIICGNGSELKSLKNQTKGLKNFILPGWINQNEIWTLMKYSNCAIAPYIRKNNFLLNLTNKPIEYLAGGLPILSSIDGVLGELITKNKCGFIYNNANKLQSYILKLKYDIDLQKTMSLNAKKIFDTKFSVKKVYSEMIVYLENIAKNFKGYDNV